MTRQVVFRPEAEDEVLEAREWYETRRSGLGTEFAQAVDEIIGRIVEILSQWERAQARFISGEPTLWKENASQREDATIFGAFGGYEKGWNEVGPRYDWASSQFKEGGATQQIEYLNTGESGDLAFTVGIERQQAQVGAQETLTPRALRVTQIFRREGSSWKLLHRHADPLMDRQPPSAVPQK